MYVYCSGFFRTHRVWSLLVTLVHFTQYQKEFSLIGSELQPNRMLGTFFMFFYIDSIPNEGVSFFAVMLGNAMKWLELGLWIVLWYIGFVNSVMIYWVAELLSIMCIFLWNSCDVFLVAVMCQYEDRLKFHFWVSFVVLWVMILLLDFKEM